MTDQHADEPLHPSKATSGSLWPTGDDADSVLAALFDQLSLIGGALAFNSRQDFAELCLSSHATPAVCIFRRPVLTTEQVATLFCTLNLPQSTADFFWVTLNKIPAERHAVRVSLDHKLSIFFKTDVPTDHIGTIAQGLGVAMQARPVSRYFQETGRRASGIAFELSSNGSPRLRFYDNIDGFAGFASTQALSEFVDRKYLMELRRLSGDATASPSVLNLSVTHDGLSAKVEAPNVHLKPPDETKAATDMQNFLRAVTRTMNRCYLSQLNYFGLRLKKTGNEVTCYLDATQARVGYVNGA